MLLIFMGMFLVVSFVWALFLIRRIFHLSHLSNRYRIEQSYSRANNSGKKFDTEFIDQILPITSKKWYLVRCYQGRRVWFMMTRAGLKLYAITFKVKASSSSLANFIKQTSLFGEWRPGIHLNSVVMNRNGDHTVKWWEKQRGLWYEDGIVGWWLEPFIDQELTVKRVLLHSNKYTGLIEHKEPVRTSTIYLAQPVVGLGSSRFYVADENDQSRLTIITTGDVESVIDECQCIDSYFRQLRAPVVNPPVIVRSCDTNGKHLNDETSVTIPGEETAAKCNGMSSAQPDGDESSFTNCEDNIDQTPGTVSGTESEDMSNKDSSSLVVKRSLFRSMKMNLSDSAQNLKRLSFRSSRSDSSKSNARKHNSQDVDVKTDSEEQTFNSFNVSREEQVPGFDQVLFLRTNSSEATTELIDYKTSANKCAADVLSEDLEAGNIVPRSKARDDVVSGWVFESTDRDVVILRKLQPGSRSQCWLGKGIIKCPPEVVWQAISNPYTRYVHDEMLKDLTVVTDLGNGMKLVKLVYSTSQLLRKDCREFYILQAERQENKRHLLTFCSIAYPEEESKECPRGKFGASGWIIDPISSRHGNTYSMVTYLSEIDLVDWDTPGAQSFEEEFIIRQPNAVADLRDFLS